MLEYLHVLGSPWVFKVKQIKNLRETGYTESQ